MRKILRNPIASCFKILCVCVALTFTVAHAATEIDKAANNLLSGGNLWIAGPEHFANEFVGRAGGLMMANILTSENEIKENDVIIALEKYAPSTRAVVLNVKNSGKYPAEINGIVEGWSMVGELSAAISRLGKWPTFFVSYGLPNGGEWAEKYKSQNFHSDFKINAIKGGQIQKAFRHRVQETLSRFEAENLEKLKIAKKWIKDAQRKIIVTMGHFVPGAIAKLVPSDYKIEHWEYFRGTEPPPDIELNSGDVVIYIGYQLAPAQFLERISKAKAHGIYVTVKDFSNTKNPNLIWLDPEWPFEDGCVNIPGYPVPILPLSQIINSLIAWKLTK